MCTRDTARSCARRHTLKRARDENAVVYVCVRLCVVCYYVNTQTHTQSRIYSNGKTEKKNSKTFWRILAAQFTPAAGENAKQNPSNTHSFIRKRLFCAWFVVDKCGGGSYFSVKLKNRHPMPWRWNVLLLLLPILPSSWWFNAIL